MDYFSFDKFLENNRLKLIIIDYMGILWPIKNVIIIIDYFCYFIETDIENPT